MSKVARDEIREQYLNTIKELFARNDEEILVTGTNEIAIPVVDAEGEEQYIVITVKVPTGSHDGDAYDAYAVAQEFEMKQAAKAQRLAQAEEKKKAQIAKDEKRRAAKRA